MGSFAEETREEIPELFPELRARFSDYGEAARPTLKRFEAALLDAEGCFAG